MAAQNGRTTLKLDDMFGKPLLLEWQGRTHTVPADVFTMDRVMRIQHLMRQGLDASEQDDAEMATAMMDGMRAQVDEFLGLARPKLALGPMSPAAMMAIANEIVTHAFGVDGAADPPTQPNRAARRTRAGTSPTRK
jgi:hypothetical protein